MKTVDPPAAPKAPRRAVPSGPWASPLVVGLVLCVGLAGAAEAAWRAQGQRPTADPEDLDLWAAERRRASSGSPRVIVLIGKSRAQLDLDLPTLKRRYPDHEVVQLALRGRGAWAVFEDLAEDPAFKGRVVWSLTEPDLALDDADAQRPAVERARRAGPDAIANARLRAWVSERLVVRSPMLEPQRVLHLLAQKDLPHPNFIVTEADRFSHADFDRANMDVVLEEILGRQRRITARMGNMQTPNGPWLQHIERVPPLLEELRARGADAAFVHLPVTGESARFSERFYPKRRFWDLFAQRVSAVSVHHRDHPVFRTFRCADTSHLDEDDAPRFTVALFRELERQRFLEPGAGRW